MRLRGARSKESFISVPATLIARGRSFALAAFVAACLFAVGGGSADAGSAGCGEPETRGGTTQGTPCDDVIVAPRGADLVRGAGGDDRIYAARSGVTLAGGSGDDVLVGRASAAAVDCPDGCDLGLGSQTFDGGPGSDVVYGERGNDVIRGNAGDDRLYGGIGDDTLHGGPDEDLLSGGWGADRIDGQGEDDQVRGDGSADTIEDSGTSTGDTLSYATALAPGFPNRDGAGGYDQSGLDSHPAFPGAGGERGVYIDLAQDIADNGVARFGGGWDVNLEASGFENVVGSPFSDYIVGSAGNNVIHGGGGADVIHGGGGTDTLLGGADGDYCEPTACDSGGVAPRDGSKASAGVIAGSAVYLSASGGADKIATAYDPATHTVTFTAGPETTFDASGGPAVGCAVTGDRAVCDLAAPPDAVVLFGGGGADGLEAGPFPTATSVLVAGGSGGDALTGGELSEDVLVDDPSIEAAGPDELAALGRDDALLNNEGDDGLDGGGGNDLFVSTSVCDGDSLGGGPGRDNASWARLGDGSDGEPVDARLSSGVAGRPSTGPAPACGPGEQLDGLSSFEDLEGTERGDNLHGDAGANNLLGWDGADGFRGGAGQDRVFANADDDDPQVGCGDGLDRVLIDDAPNTDSAAEDCEIVEEAPRFTFSFTIEPLAEPGLTATDPPSPANDNAPEIRGTAVAGSTVRLYTSADCASATLAGVGSEDQFGSTGITVSVPDNSTTTFYATARDETSASDCSDSSISYTESTPDVPPTAVADAVTVPEDSGPTAIDALANDPDPDGGPKAIESAGQPLYGSVTVSAGGSALTYEPPPNWCGTTEFPYTLNGGSTATVKVRVTCVPEPVKCGGLLVTRRGTSGRDVIRGTRKRDTIAAFGGNDVIRGFAGNDRLCGGGGRDTLIGGKGRDVLLGGPGRDRLLGGPGRDRARQ